MRSRHSSLSPRSCDARQPPRELLPTTAWLVCVLSVAAPCQQPAGSPAQPLPAEVQRIAVHRSAGLFELAPGVLHGGGAYYDVRFDSAGMRFEPALGSAVATTQYLQMTPTSVGRGGEPAALLPSAAVPEQNERTALFAHIAGVRERYEVGVDGVEVSWVFDQRPAGHGDLVVRYAIDTEMPGPVAAADGGLGFGLEGIGGVSIGAVTGIDAAGRNVAGALRYADGALEMSLPANFVDGATYPLVLDPVIGAKFGIWNGPAYDDTEPDCSYDQIEDRYLIVFLRTFAATDVRVRGQLVNRTGTLHQGVIWITTGGLSFRPRVATFSRESRFGVVWVQHVSLQDVAYFRSVSAIGGPPSAPMPSASPLHWSGLWTISDLDIGSEAGAPQQNHAFRAVWDNTSHGRIYGSRIGIDSAGNATVHPIHTVFADGILSSYSQPAIARASEADGKLMVVARRFTTFGPQRGIASALVSARHDTVGPFRTIVQDSTNDYQRPDVDGYGDEWVVAWRENTLGSNLARVSTRSARLAGGIVNVGPIVTLGSALLNVDYPSVGYSHGKTWLGYYQVSLLGPVSLRARGIDSNTCQSCQDTFTESVPGGNNRIVTATTMSGNAVLRDEALIVWGETLDIWAQRVANHSGSGSVTNLGGGCGAGGNQNANAPAIGMNQIHCSVTNLSPTAMLSMFNLTTIPTFMSCGPCEWLPIQVGILTVPTQFNTASVDYTFPCAQWLIGLQFQTQWTTLDPGTAPCATYPGFAVSDRVQHVIGQ